jgi:hypothetical protein
MPLGISYDQVDKDSFLGLRREDVILPIALDIDYFSSASAGSTQGNFDCSASVAGTAVFLAAQAAKPLFYARRPSLTITDASGTTLVVKVRIVGRRFGELVVQDITSGTAVSGTPVTVSGTRVIDELVSATILSITANTTSDTLSVGIDGSFLGLMCPIRSYRDVKMIYKIDNGTPDSAGPLTTSDLSTTLVNVRDSAIDLKTLYATIAVTDRFLIEYVAANSGKASYRRKGVRFV